MKTLQQMRDQLATASLWDELDIQDLFFATVNPQTLETARQAFYIEQPELFRLMDACIAIEGGLGQEMMAIQEEQISAAARKAHGNNLFCYLYENEI
jgi:hypothetical protein